MTYTSIIMMKIVTRDAQQGRLLLLFVSYLVRPHLVRPHLVRPHLVRYLQLRFFLTPSRKAAKSKKVINHLTTGGSSA